MNDLDFVRQLRADMPEPSTARLDAGRARLTAAMQTRTGPAAPRSHPECVSRWLVTRGSSSRRIRPVVALTTGAAAAALAAAAVVAVSGEPASHSEPGRASTPIPVHLTLAARVLRSAAVAAAGSEAIQPRAGQWFYSKTVAYEYGQQPATTVDQEWGTFDGRYTAYYQGTQLIVHKTLGPVSGSGPTALDRFDVSATPRTAYRALASLPRDPAALLTVIEKHAARLAPGDVVSPIQMYAPTSPSQAAFAYLIQLLWNAADGEPSAAQATAYLAMADMPGVSVQQGITDAAGQPAIGVSDNNGIDQLLLDPGTFAIIGIRELSTGVSPFYVKSRAQMVRNALAGLKGAQLKAMQAELKKHENQMWQKVQVQNTMRWPPKGAVVESLAIAELKQVSRPGAR
jgi:hypothetical protein